MGKIAFVFSGQGAQYPGMGRELCGASEAAAAAFERFDRIAPGTSEMCFSGTAEQLTETRNTQRCMYAMEIAAMRALQARGVSADAAAGFSLGELPALVCAGVLSEDDGFRLVCRRGELMQAAAEAVDGGMAAVVKLTDAQVEALCARFEHVYPVNYNCPGQVSVSGLRAELQPFSQAVKEAGGRALPLKVRSCFHSPFMRGAAAKFAEAVAPVEFRPAQLPLYSNLTGEIYGSDPKTLLAEQIANPVRWSTIIQNMLSSGVDSFIELGPGKTLSGFIARIAPGARVLHVEDAASLEAAAGEVAK